MLTADAFGVLASIRALTPAQAMYHFRLSGFTIQGSKALSVA